jgi:hypothetical protein
MSTEIDVESRAKELGWSSKEQFRGDLKNWVDAETYLRRGEEVMPILRQNNKKLDAELTATKIEVGSLKAALEASQASIKELKDFNTAVTKEKAAQIKADLMAELVEAKKSGDFETEIRVKDQLDEHNEAIRKSEAAPAKVEAKVTPASESAAVVEAKQVFSTWAAENSWYNDDPIKTGLANGIAQKLRKDGSPLIGRAFYDEVSKQVEAFGGKAAPRTDKVEGGGRGNGSGGGGSNAQGKSFADLPQAAKDAAEKFARKGDISIGKGKTFETLDAWRAHYATKYFERE